MSSEESNKMSKKTLSQDSNFNFLGVYDNALSKEECNKVLQIYEHATRGRIGYHVGLLDRDNYPHKRAHTLACDLKSFPIEEHHGINSYVENALSRTLPDYIEKYSFLKQMGIWHWDTPYNVQKYKEGEGYYTLHCEHAVDFPRRILVWMVYLNDCECGTEYPYQDTIVDAKAGRVVFWPAGWTHPHKGVTPNKGVKYIATGWYSYYEKHTN